MLQQFPAKVGPAVVGIDVDGATEAGGFRCTNQHV